MESRLIYVTTNRLLGNIKWLNETLDNGAWMYIGEFSALNRNLILININEFLTTDELHISWKRNESRTVLRVDVESKIAGILGHHDFSIWDNSFARVIEFNKNGVMRIGKLDLLR